MLLFTLQINKTISKPCLEPEPVSWAQTELKCGEKRVCVCCCACVMCEKRMERGRGGADCGKSCGSVIFVFTSGDKWRVEFSAQEIARAFATLHARNLEKRRGRAKCNWEMNNFCFRPEPKPPDVLGFILKGRKSFLIREILHVISCDDCERLCFRGSDFFQIKRKPTER